MKPAFILVNAFIFVLLIKSKLLHLFINVYYLVIGIQVIYFLLFIIGFLKKRNPGQASPQPVSVIVCAHDEEDHLKELIPALLAQDHPEFEVIIIDDRSNDGTFDLLLSEAPKDHRLRIVHVNRTPEHANSKKYALTLGIKAARYEWILHTDADCRPASASWISSMATQFTEETNFVLGYSPYLEGPGLLNAFIRFETLVTALQYISFALLGIPYMGIGRNLAYRRSRFMKANGFGSLLPITGGDDDLYVNRHATGRNTRVCVMPAAQTLSFPEASWRAFLRQKLRHLSVGKWYRLHHRLFLGLFVASWILSWFLGIVLAVMMPTMYVIAFLLGLRILLVLVTIQLSSGRLGQKFDIRIVPLLDFIYAFYYLVTGLRALVTQKVRWKS